MDNTILINSLAAKAALKNLRNRDLAIEEFRSNSEIVCKALIGEVVNQVGKEDLAVLPVLRAGIAMLPSVLQIVPGARVGFVGLARDEETAVASEYYWKLPEITQQTTVLITDPMLATGGSILHILKKLGEKVLPEIIITSVICAPEGIEKIRADFPEVRIVTAAIDEGLDSKKFIVPGLGDYGDRYFGTV